MSASALAAAAARWPQLFDGLAPERRADLAAGLRQTRPVLVRGYESMVMARLLLEEGPGCADRILSGWEPLLQASLESWGEDWETLQAGFEAQRAEWLASDRAAWLALNQPYAGMVDALADCQQPVYFASRCGAGGGGAARSGGSCGHGRPPPLLPPPPPARARAAKPRTGCPRCCRNTLAWQPSHLTRRGCLPR